MDRADEGEVRRDGGNTADRADRARKHEILHCRGKRTKAATRARSCWPDRDAGGGSNRGSRGPDD